MFSTPRRCASVDSLAPDVYAGAAVLTLLVRMQVLGWSTAIVAVFGSLVTFLGSSQPIAVSGPIQHVSLAGISIATAVPSPLLLAAVIATLQPTLVPTAAPTLAPAAIARPTSGPTPAAATPTSQPTLQVIVDERFADNNLGWPDDPDLTGWFTPEGYRLEPRDPAKFVAIGPASAPRRTGVQVTATFHKLDGRPPGGGYGIIVRQQDSDRLDGQTTVGRYYVLEVGDRGEVGIWRREADQWIDLVPWTPSSAVHPGTAANELVARASGRQLSLRVNGVVTAQVEDQTLDGGAVGVFVGGDGNAAVLTRFLVQELN